MLPLFVALVVLVALETGDPFTGVTDVEPCGFLLLGLGLALPYACNRSRNDAIETAPFVEFVPDQRGDAPRIRPDGDK